MQYVVASRQIAALKKKRHHDMRNPFHALAALPKLCMIPTKLTLTSSVTTFKTTHEKRQRELMSMYY